MTFETFAQLVNAQFNMMAQHELYTVDLNKDTIWATYLSSFPEGTNPIYLERPVHDCNCCKSFIRNIGNVVTVIDNKLVSIWDVEASDEYSVVTQALSALIKTRPINSLYRSVESKYGAKSTMQVLPTGGTINWNHFYATIPAKFVAASIGEVVSEFNSSINVFKRGLEEFNPECIQTILDLINANNLYKGIEHKTGIEAFQKFQEAYNALDSNEARNIFIFANNGKYGSRIKNTSIGELISNYSKGDSIEVAVGKYESMVAGPTYKRSSALITPSMIKAANETIQSLDLEESLHRRHATTADISIANTLFVDRTVAKTMQGSILDILQAEVRTKPAKTSSTQDISVQDFLTMLPKIDSIEVQFENKHQSNLMSLVTAQNLQAPNLFKWDNPVSWSYTGNVTDSGLKANVKAAGGNVDGILRFSIQWNEELLDRENDLDAHCIHPGGGEIYYGDKQGKLDVDIQRPKGNTAVENIVFKTAYDLVNGTYKFFVVNFSGRNTKGFRAQVEIDGVIHEFNHDRPVSRQVTVAEVTYNNGTFTFDPKIPCSSTPVTKWGIKANSFHKVQMVTFSPNFWDSNEAGNQHLFFLLQDCKNPDPVIGMYNEYIKADLHQHRKVFEVLSTKLMCEPSDNQLSGLGYSLTKRDEVIIKVRGEINGTFNLKF